MEVTAAKEEEAAAAVAATRRVAAERAGSNMSRYDEILERSKAWGGMDMEGWEEGMEGWGQEGMGGDREVAW